VDFIERRIITGLIVSTDYIRQVQLFWKTTYLQAVESRLVAGWCFDYFKKYNKAPGREIEAIFAKYSRKANEKQARVIAEILEDLSEEYERGQFNVDYLLDETRQYFIEQELRDRVDRIEEALEVGAVEEAQKLASGYVPMVLEDIQAIDPLEDSRRIKEAFTKRRESLIHLPKALGEFMNDQLVREGFVAFQGPEKRGKTYLMMELGIRALRSGCNVAFFQAGDLSEDDMIIRLAIYLTKRSNVPRYCKEIWIPQVDCLRNQNGECDLPQREENDEVPFEGESLGSIQSTNLEDFLTVCENLPDYSPCHNCKKDFLGAVWMKKRPAVPLLTWKGAVKAAKEFRSKVKRRFRLSTHASNTLDVPTIFRLLELWEVQDGFVPDVVIVDYADILAPAPDMRGESYRNKVNSIWMGLRQLSQVKKVLVITATQSDANSYEIPTQKMRNFSEDKRKYAHVTAMYGMNQTETEKRLGMLRLNELVVRQGDFSTNRQVVVLQSLAQGRPLVGSFPYKDLSKSKGEE